MNAKLVSMVEDKLLETMLLAQTKFGRTFELPKLSFDINSGRTAGQAFYADWKIKINPKYLVACTDEVISRTVPHEVAHLINCIIYPNAKQSHGPEWKSVATKLGIEPVRCHSMQEPESRPHTYVCNCRKWYVSNLIHRKMQYRQRHCPKCKGSLAYLNSIQ